MCDNLTNAFDDVMIIDIIVTTLCLKKTAQL